MNEDSMKELERLRKQDQPTGKDGFTRTVKRRYRT